MKKFLLLLTVIASICGLSGCDDSPLPNSTNELPIIFTAANCSKCKALEQQKIAAIVEPRSMPGLIEVIKAVKSKLDKDEPGQWIIQVFHGTNNEQFLLKSELKPLIDSGDIILSKMNIANLTVQDYNAKVLLNLDFWKKIPGEYILSFETDSVLCSGSPHKITEFEQYDYIGAPLTGALVQKGVGPCRIFREKTKDKPKYVAFLNEVSDQLLIARNFEKIGDFNPVIGNSGISFKKRSKMIAILENYAPLSAFYIHRSSDLFIGCVALDPAIAMNIPLIETATHFSVETEFYEQPLAVHKPWPTLSTSQIEQLAQKCPEIDSVLRPIYKF